MVYGRKRRIHGGWDRYSLEFNPCCGWYDKDRISLAGTDDKFEKYPSE